MPNWTFNNTQIKGNKIDIDNFMSIITKKDENNKDWYDFTACNPMPVELENLHQGSRNIDGIKVDTWYEDDGEARPMMDMVKDRLLKNIKIIKQMNGKTNNVL